MKKVLLLICSLALFASLAYGQSWNPTPMVIDVPAAVQYAFNGTDVNIPFSLSGKPGRFYLVIETKLDDAQKPVAVMNGLRGWHFVNGIDTTIYVSSGRDYSPAVTNSFPWDGFGNEKEYDVFKKNNTAVAPGTYSYYIIGYDNKSSREMCNNFLEGGNSQTPKRQKFYPYDPQTGAVLAHPLYLGKGVKSVSGTNVFKFTLGDDPYDVSKITTSFCWGFAKGDVVPDQSITSSNIIFDVHNFDTFYMTKAKRWEFANTVSKWTFVPLGQAIEDPVWGNFDKVNEWSNESDVSGGVIEQDGEGNLYWNLCGKNPVNFQVGKLIGLDESDPTVQLFYQMLDEYYQANPIVESDGVMRSDSEAGRLEKGWAPGQLFMCGDASCCLELLDAHKMIDGATEPWATDGSGYVIWTNSNGDWFGDKNTYIEPVDSQPQLWACISFEPRNFNQQRTTPNANYSKEKFEVAWFEFAQLYSCGAYTPDGTGIDYWQFADDSFSAGGDNTQKKQNGSSLDVDSQFDGLYTRNPMMANPAWGDNSYLAMTWFAYDVDGGIISNNPVQPAVEEDAPAAFSVAQNTPNPFNPTTKISFTLTKAGQTSVEVFNVAGQKVATLANDVMSAGNHSVTWDANGFAAGVYFYTVKSGDYAKTLKMTLLK